jgi:hypothetical protein
MKVRPSHLARTASHLQQLPLLQSYLANNMEGTQPRSKQDNAVCIAVNQNASDQSPMTSQFILKTTLVMTSNHDVDSIPDLESISSSEEDISVTVDQVNVGPQKSFPSGPSQAYFCCAHRSGPNDKLDLL